MSERKVLTKYYPPDFDPSKLKRERNKSTGPKQITIRLMAPFSMKCTSCGEYIYKGRKFNARKETAEEKYLGISIFRFYIRCTRCSSEITFKTDPKNMDYICEKGAKRNFETWREGHIEETDEERLNRLQHEDEEKDADAMQELEAKTMDAKTEMNIADALDEIRSRNARNEMTAKARGGDIVTVERTVDDSRARQEREDAEAAKKAFAARQELLQLEAAQGDTVLDVAPVEAVVAPPASDMAPPLVPSTFKRTVKKKKDFGAALGIKKKPALV